MTNPIQYFVCDPSYITPIPTWLECCKILFEYDEEIAFPKFKEALTDALVKITGYPAYVSEVSEISEISGKSWVNSLSGDDIIIPYFASKTGYVAVSRVTWQSLKNLYDRYTGEKALIGTAMFNMSEDITVNFDRSNPKWTVVRIKDNISQKEIHSLERGDKETVKKIHKILLNRQES